MNLAIAKGYTTKSIMVQESALETAKIQKISKSTLVNLINSINSQDIADPLPLSIYQ